MQMQVSYRVYARRHDDLGIAMLRCGVNRSLDGLGAVGFAVANRAKGGNVIDVFRDLFFPFRYFYQK